jgi:ankyrin repeat protein
MNITALLNRFFHSHISGTAIVFSIMLAWSIPAFCGEIHDAALRGDLAKVKALLKDHPEIVSSKDDNGVTPLHRAAEYGHKDMVELLLANGADVNAQSRNGWTPLNGAMLRGNQEVAELLRKHGGIFGETENDSSARPFARGSIHDAARKSDLQKVKTMLKENPELVSSKDKESRTPLYYAVEMGNKDVAELLLANNADANAKAPKTVKSHDISIGTLTFIYSDWTPLHLAVEKRYKEIAELLLAKGADVNVRNGNGETPLHVVAQITVNNPVDFQRLAKSGGADLKEIAELLLVKGANVNARNNNGETPLHIAMSSPINSTKPMVESLLAHGAEVNAKSFRGETPLSRAELNGQKDIAELLRRHGGNSTGDPEEKSIHEAARRGDLARVKMLLKDNPNFVSSKDNDGLMPLHHAASIGNKDMIELLLANNADVNATAQRQILTSRGGHPFPDISGSGMTPMHYAAMSGNKDVVELLLANKADVNAKDREGLTPLHAAEAHGHKDIVELLRRHGGHE